MPFSLTVLDLFFFCPLPLLSSFLDVITTREERNKVPRGSPCHVSLLAGCPLAQSSDATARAFNPSQQRCPCVLINTGHLDAAVQPLDATGGDERERENSSRREIRRTMGENTSDRPVARGEGSADRTNKMPLYVYICEEIAHSHPLYSFVRETL